MGYDKCADYRHRDKNSSGPGFDSCSIVGSYVTKLPESVEKMRYALQQRDYKALEFISHKIRGTSESLSFFEISETAGCIEDLARCMEIENFDELAHQKARESLNDLENFIFSRQDMYRNQPAV